MKYSYLFLGMLCLLAKPAAAQTTYPGGVPNCIARWDFSSTGTFTTLPDVSTNGNAGATYNMSTASGFRGIANTAGSFNGTTSYATVTNKAMLSPSAVTIISVVKPSNYNAAGCQYNTILVKGVDYNVPGCYGMTIFDNDNDCNALGTSQTVDHIGPNASLPFSGTAMATNNWYFLATSYDGVIMKRYCVPLDGSIYTTNVSSSSGGPVTALGTNSADIRIGQNQNASPIYQYPFTGDIDEIALFNKALTEEEIQSVYNYVWGGLNINMATLDTFICPGTPFALSYTVHNNSTFSSGNSFTAELSDASGSFASPTVIGSTVSSITGAIPCIMPTSASGSGYRIRITANSPMYVSPNNGKNIATGHRPTSSAITASPGTTVGNGIDVTFTVDAPNKGTTITYQWRNKNVQIIGAPNSPTYIGKSGVDFMNGDEITCMVKVSDIYCNYADSAQSNKLTMSVGVGIKSISNINDLKVFPNPNNGSFNIQGVTKSNAPVTIEVMNAIGQVVHRDIWTPANNKLDNNIKLNDAAAGIYMLRAKADGNISTIRFTVSE